MLLLAALWIGMSAQAQIQVRIPTCEGCWQIFVTENPLDDIVLAEFADDAQNCKTIPNSNGAQICNGASWHPSGAADETDGKPSPWLSCIVSDEAGNSVPCWKEQGKYGTQYPIGEEKPLTKDSPNTYACTDQPEYFPQMPLCHPAEPVDVPAVQEPTESECGASWHQDQVSILCTNHGTPDLPKGTPAPLDRTIPGKSGYITTCTDKSRILLHDESNPPKFWCHRVQSQ